MGAALRRAPGLRLLARHRGGPAVHARHPQGADERGMKDVQDWFRRQALRWPPLYRLLRSVKHRMLPRLAGDAFSARIEVDPPLPEFRVAEVRQVGARVTNTSRCAWPGGQIALSYHWRSPDGSVWGYDGGRTPFA